VNVALIALSDEEYPVAPPLVLAYVATVLEQRGFIVRIYDLALNPSQTLSAALRPLRAFSPHLALVSGCDVAGLEAVQHMLQTAGCRVLTMRVDRDFLEIDTLCADVMTWVSQYTQEMALGSSETAKPVQSFNLDELPFPARHLLSLECYDLRAPGGELQTTLLIGTPCNEQARDPFLRAPTQIVGELRSVAREFGVRHYRFPGVSLTSNREWLAALLTHLRDAHLGIFWEGEADGDRLDEELLGLMAGTGCEALRLSLRATHIFESAEARAHLRRIVSQARAVAIKLYATLELEPPYEALANLVDVTASFALDDISFSVRKHGDHLRPHMSMPETDVERNVEAMAEQMYYAGLRRQRLVERYGPMIGGLIWRLRGTGLLSSAGGDSSSTVEPL
jgi:hypothetical protein